MKSKSRHRPTSSSLNEQNKTKDKDIPSSSRASGGSKDDTTAESLPVDSFLIDSVLIRDAIYEKCAKLNAVIERDGTTNRITTDELDQIQKDLETVLLRVVTRQKAIIKSIDVLEGKATDTQKAVSTRKRGRGKGKDERSSPMPEADIREKSMTETCSISSTSSSTIISSVAYLPKPVPMPDGTANGGTVNGRRRSQYAFPANDFPDRFWAFIDEYCAPCTSADVAYLQNLITQCNSDSPPDQTEDGSRSHSRKHSSCSSIDSDYLINRSRKRKANSMNGKLLHRIKKSPTAKKSRRFSQSEDVALEYAIKCSNIKTEQFTFSENRASRSRSKTELKKPLPFKNGFLKHEPVDDDEDDDDHTDKNGAAPDDDKTPLCLGPLTQRVIQALLEESSSSSSSNGSSAPAPMDTAGSTTSGQQHSHNTRKSPAKSPPPPHSPKSPKNGVKEIRNLNGFTHSGMQSIFNLPDFKSIEEKLTKELIEHGFLDSSDTAPSSHHSDDSESLDYHTANEDEDDEVSLELKTRLDEMCQLRSRLKPKLERLSRVVNADVTRTELKRQLDELDAQIRELGDKYYSCGHPRRRPTKKEKEAALKVMAQREVIVSQLDLLPLRW